MREGERKIVIECIKEREKEGDKKVGRGNRELFLRQNGFRGNKVTKRKRSRCSCDVKREGERENGSVDGWKDNKF